MTTAFDTQATPSPGKAMLRSEALARRDALDLDNRLEWDAEIVEQVPDKRIAWRSTTGTPNSGVVRFEPQGASRTKIVLELTYTPTDPVEKAGDVLGAVGLEARGNLKKFKEMIEARGSETGAWRGTIHSPDSPRVTH